MLTAALAHQKKVLLKLVGQKQVTRSQLKSVLAKTIDPMKFAVLFPDVQ